jgi:hypothetical protein
MPLLDKGVARGGSTNTLTLSAISSSVNGAYVGANIRLISGPASGQERIITAYDGATKVATVSPWAGPYLDLPGSADDGALASFVMDGSDLGNGAVNTALLFGTGTATFTRASAAATKLSTGLWKLDVASGVARYSYNGATTAVSTTGGYFSEPAATQLAINPTDMTQVQWVAVNVTAVQNAVGIDGSSNSATTLTATAIGGSVLQTVVAAASTRTYGVWLRRTIGTGTITISQGATTLDVTAQLNSATLTLVQLPASVLNAAFGITFGTSGDAVVASYNQFEAGEKATSPIPPVGFRLADVLSYAAGNVNIAAGTAYAELYTNYSAAPSTGNPCAVANDTNGLMLYVAPSNLTTTNAMFDGTTAFVKSGMSDMATGVRKRASSWGGLGLALTGDGLAPQTAAFDGAMGAVTTVEIGSVVGANQFMGTVRNVRLWLTQLLSATLQSITTNGVSFKFATYPTSFPDNTTGYEIDGLSKAGDSDVQHPSMVKPIGLLTRPKKPAKKAKPEPVVVPKLKSLETPEEVEVVEPDRVHFQEFVSPEQDAAAQAELAGVLAQKRLQEEFILAAVVEAINANLQAAMAKRQAEIQHGAQMLQDIKGDVESVAQAVQQLLAAREKIKRRQDELQVERQAEEEKVAAEEATAKESQAKEAKTSSMFERAMTGIHKAIESMAATKPDKSITMTMPDGRQVKAEVKNK